MDERIPPCSLEAEQATLGSMMLEAYGLSKGLEILVAADFTRPTNQVIFEALSSLSKRREPADLITLQEELRASGKLADVGGTEYLMSLVESVPTAANIEHYARIVEGKSILRKIIAEGSKSIAMAHEDEDDVDKVIESYTRRAMGIRRRSKGGGKLISDAVMNAVKEFSEFESGVSPFGILWGIDKIDIMTRGVGPKPGLTIVGARPSNGKTSLANDLAINCAREGKRCAYFTLETTAEELVQRMTFRLSGVSNSRYYGRNWNSDEEYFEAVNRMVAAEAELFNLQSNIIFHDDTESLSQLIQQAHQDALKGDLGLVIVDYLQIIELDKARDSQRTENAVRAKALLNLSKDIHCPVVALSQISREGVKRGAQKDDPYSVRGWSMPSMSNLLEGGNLEGIAKCVIILHNPPSLKTEDDEEDMPRNGFIVVDKNKDGRTGIVPVWYDGGCYKFTSQESRYDDPPQQYELSREAAARVASENAGGE
jgi:replicative DNA helicase